MADEQPTNPEEEAPAESAADGPAQSDEPSLPAESSAPAEQSMELPPLEGGAGTSSEDESKIALLGDVNLNVKVELGRTRMFVEDVLRLNEGCVVELDKPAGDPVDIYVNDRHVARGEVLVVNDAFCVRISEIVDSASAQVREEMAVP